LAVAPVTLVLESRRRGEKTSLRPAGRCRRIEGMPSFDVHPRHVVPMPQNERTMTIDRSRPERGLALVGWSGVLLLASIGALGLLALWLVAVALIPLSIGIPPTLVLTNVVRWFTDQHRVWAGDRLGGPVDRPYRPTPPGNQLQRLRAELGDPATWRDVAWLTVDSSRRRTIGACWPCSPTSRAEGFQATSRFASMECTARLLSEASTFCPRGVR
jgi:hypothetical protein